MRTVSRAVTLFYKATVCQPAKGDFVRSARDVPPHNAQLLVRSASL